MELLLLSWAKRKINHNLLFRDFQGRKDNLNLLFPFKSLFQSLSPSHFAPSKKIIINRLCFHFSFLLSPSPSLCYFSLFVLADPISLSLIFFEKNLQTWKQPNLLNWSGDLFANTYPLTKKQPTRDYFQKCNISVMFSLSLSLQKKEISHFPTIVSLLSPNLISFYFLSCQSLTSKGKNYAVKQTDEYLRTSNCFPWNSIAARENCEIKTNLRFFMSPRWTVHLSCTLISCFGSNFLIFYSRSSDKMN